MKNSGKSRSETLTKGMRYSFPPGACAPLPRRDVRKATDWYPDPSPFVRPFVRPSPLVIPFVWPRPFVSPFVRPTPFVNPFVRPRNPFVRPFVRPRSSFVRPRSPFVLPVLDPARLPKATPFVRPFLGADLGTGFPGPFGVGRSSFVAPPNSSWTISWIATRLRSSSSLTIDSLGSNFTPQVAHAVASAGATASPNRHLKPPPPTLSDARSGCSA